VTIDSAPERDAALLAGRVELGQWPKLLRTNCRLLSESSPQLMSAVSTTARLGDDPSAPDAIRFVGEALAAEYGLRLTFEVHGASATARLSRPAGRRDDGAGGATGDDEDPLGLAYLPEGGFVPEGSAAAGALTLVVALGLLAATVLAAYLTHLPPFAA